MTDVNWAKSRLDMAENVHKKLNGDKGTERTFGAVFRYNMIKRLAGDAPPLTKEGFFKSTRLLRTSLVARAHGDTLAEALQMYENLHNSPNSPKSPLQLFQLMRKLKQQQKISS